MPESNKLQRLWEQDGSSATAAIWRWRTASSKLRRGSHRGGLRLPLARHHCRRRRPRSDLEIEIARLNAENRALQEEGLAFKTRMETSVDLLERLLGREPAERGGAGRAARCLGRAAAAGEARRERVEQRRRRRRRSG